MEMFPNDAHHAFHCLKNAKGVRRKGRREREREEKGKVSKDSSIKFL